MIPWIIGLAASCMTSASFTSTMAASTVVSTSTSTATPIACLASARGSVTKEGGVGTHERSRLHAPDCIFAGDTVEVSADGFSDWIVVDGMRLRASGEGRFGLVRASGKMDVRLSSGRMWLEVPSNPSDSTRDSVTLTIRDVRAAVAPGSSVVVEAQPWTPDVVVLRRGAVMFAEGRLEPNRVALVRASGVVFVALGDGETAADRIANEARSALGDMMDLRRFVLARIVEGLATKDVSSTRQRQRLRTRTPLMHESDPLSDLLEQAIRPPMFFDSEVPGKGPNVKVEVRFSK